MNDPDGPTEPGSADGLLPGGISVAPMRRRHLEAVVAIESHCYPSPWSRPVFESELRDPVTRRYRVVLSEENDVVAYFGMMLIANEGHITTVTVDPTWQGRRLGTLMLLDIARSGPALGVTDLTLEVRAGNTAAKLLYRRFGFAPVGIRRNYYPETGEDGIVMWAYGIDASKYLSRLDDIEARLRSPL